MINVENAFPDYAQDIKLNFTSLLKNATPLTPQQFWGILLASAYASKNKFLFKQIDAEAHEKISPAAIKAAKAAAALMAMNNVYYRFTHLVSNPSYTQLPAQLRMTSMANPGVEKLDFELFSLAVSAINGCGKCMDAHEQTLRKNNASVEVIQTAVRIAAITHAAALVLPAD